MRFRTALVVAAWLAAGLGTAAVPGPAARADDAAPEREARLPQPFERTVELAAGQVVEIAAAIARPADLPANGRVLVTWEAIGQGADRGWSKRLHALDADAYVLYRAPAAGSYRLKVGVDDQPTDLFEANRWRERGSVPAVVPVPTVPWPADARATVKTLVRVLDAGGEADARLFLETEPNSLASLAQPIPLPTTTDEYSLHVVGTADDLEFFDNSHVGRPAGDDWFTLEFPGPEPRLLTATLAIPDQQVAAQIRCYVPGKEPGDVAEYKEGQNPNERDHQQPEPHRAAINRKLDPGKTYYLRVEANAPGYELELRVVRPAPYDDPRRAVKQALYDHVGQVDAWLTNRPRGASVERRIRDTGNLLGTGCMSCHTQSGVWGPAIPFAQGYPPENVQSWRNLVTISYQSLRPTNKLVDAANNTSLAPLDTGDGPAGTRVAGHALASVESLGAPRRLQSQQLVRCANYVLQTGDPGGVNAAGPGANHGHGVVLNYTGEILAAAWKRTGNPHYFHALVDRANRLVNMEVKFTDDMAHRVEFLKRFLPADYPACAEGVPADAAALADAKWTVKGPTPLTPEQHRELAARIAEVVAGDLACLRAIQNEDGSWHFSPGASDDAGKTWRRTAKPGERDPAPTALALIALESAGAKADDPAVAKGVKALLSMQHPTGYWNAASQTGFVTTSYSMHALSRLFPLAAPKDAAAAAAAASPATLVADLRAARDRAQCGPQLHAGAGAATAAEIAAMVAAARHPFPLVRYWSMVGLGAAAALEGVPALVAGLGDTAKPVRTAAAWALRQTLTNDVGWDGAFAAFGGGDDRTREAAAIALVMRVDGVLTGAHAGWDRLTAALSRGMLDDPHPAVRAWSSRAAWNWWIWNPPVRGALNEAWVKLLTRPEPHALVENCHRYQTQALFVANGHRANASGDHQYAELAALFTKLAELRRSEGLDAAAAERLDRRLIAVAATFFEQAGGDGGPGQLGYSTPGAGGLFGEVVLAHFSRVDAAAAKDDLAPLKLGLEAAANVPHKPLQKKLIDYSLNGPESLRPLAAGSISDPRSAQLVAVPEALEPLVEQILRGVLDPARRAQLAEPLFKLFARVRFVVPQTVEQQRQSLEWLIPRFSPTPSIGNKGEPTAALAADKRNEAEWYLASKLGDVLAENPDLHIDTTFEFFPETFSTPLEARFWLPSVDWILTHKTKLPEVKAAEGELPPVDPFAEPRSRALRLFLGQLATGADPRNIELAVQLAGKTALRRNPEVLTALEKLLETESRKPVIEQARKVLSTGRDSFLKELAAAVQADTAFDFPRDKAGDPELPKAFIEDVAYFRDYVTPEMSTVLRGDQRSCFACHGIPGRVPPLTLNPPDEAGYLPVAKLLENYRLLCDRVDPENVERSKLLRKPLNVQTGDEDGHQGGRRYQPTDAGYQVLLTWARNQAKLQRRE